MPIQVGLEATVERVVGDGDTAVALGSGDVAVLGTPAVVALCEAAAVRALDGALGQGETSVGVRIELEHLAPTLVGKTVSAVARVTSVDGRTLAFDIEASDEVGLVARGTHVRAVVDRERFEANANKRA